MSITSANSVFTLLCTALFPAPQQLQKWAVDDGWSFESATMAETQKGVDGKKSEGFTPFNQKMGLAFQADSPSIRIFDIITQAQKAAQEVFRLDGSLLNPATGKSFTLTNGTLTVIKAGPDGKKLLSAQQYTIEWDSVDPAVV
jgi:hypothetical protein